MSKIAYAAGFIDGEGSICVTVDTRPLRLLQKLFGGRLYTGDHNKWTWTLSHRDRVAPALRYLIPFLIVKQANAKLVLNYCRLLRFYKHGKRLTAWEKAARKWYYWQTRKEKVIKRLIAT
jgi:hypothetical protein